jgi:hypothetical protein
MRLTNVGAALNRTSASRVAGRIWAVGRPDLGGRPAGFGGPAGRFWGVGWPGRSGGQPLTTYGSTTTYLAPVPIYLSLTPSYGAFLLIQNAGDQCLSPFIRAHSGRPARS